MNPVTFRRGGRNGGGGEGLAYKEVVILYAELHSYCTTRNAPSLNESVSQGKLLCRISPSRHSNHNTEKAQARCPRLIALLKRHVGGGRAATSKIFLLIWEHLRRIPLPRSRKTIYHPGLDAADIQSKLCSRQALLQLTLKNYRLVSILSACF